MAFIPVLHAVRSSLIYICDGQTLVNTLHFTFATTPTEANMAALNTALINWYNAQLKNTVTAAVALSGVNTIGLDASNSPGVFTAVVPVSPGVLGGGPLPANVSWCSTLRTGFRGRSYRGRWYHPTVAAGSQNGVSAITSIAVAAIQGALATLLTPANVANFTWVIVSRFLNKLPRNVGITTPITSIAGDLTLDSQRRRLPGRGA